MRLGLELGLGLGLSSVRKRKEEKKADLADLGKSSHLVLLPSRCVGRT